MATPQVFTRKATGLVREASAFDAFVYNINFINVGIGAAFAALFMAADYAGVSLTLGTVLVLIMSIPTALIYAMFAAAMPRSGGDYVYVSRVLGPTWGMIGSWNWTIWNILYMGTPAAYFGEYGLSQFFRVVGALTASNGMISLGNWFATPLGAFVAGAVLIVVFIAMFVKGLRFYMKVQNVLFGLALLSVILSVAVLLGASHQDFVQSFNSYVARLGGHTDAYAYIMKATKTSPAPAVFSFKNTLIAMTWLYLVMGFNIGSAYIGGEIKNSSKSQLFAMPVGALFAGAAIFVILLLLQNVIGMPFLGALGQIGYTVPASAVGMPLAPLYPELTVALAHNVVIGVLIAFGFIFWTYTWMPGNIMIPSRNLLAYAVDGVGPRIMGEVSETLHAPVWNLVIIGALGIAALWVFLFGHLPILSGIAGFVLTFLITSVAAMAFPYKLKAVFESSPVNWRVGGIPVITILGAISFVFVALMEYFYLSAWDSGVGILAPPVSRTTWIMFFVNVGILLLGGVIYAITKAWRKRQGIDVTLSFKEIPPE